MIVLDFDLSSSLRGPQPSAYDGFWKDLNFLHVMAGTFDNQQRCFAFSANTTDNTIELWEIVMGQTGYDMNYVKGAPVYTPVTWSFESSVMFSNLKTKGEYEYVQLQDGEVYLSDLKAPPGGNDAMATGTIAVWYRPDYDPCWYPWFQCSFGQGDLPRVGLGCPPLIERAFTGGRPPSFGRFFQFRFEMTGDFIFKGALFAASPEPQPPFQTPLCNLPALGQT